MTKERVRKPVECKVLRVLRETELKGKASTKGLNKKSMRVARWFKLPPKLENRNLFFSEATGEWIARGNSGFDLVEFEFLIANQEAIRALLRQKSGE